MLHSSKGVVALLAFHLKKKRTQMGKISIDEKVPKRLTFVFTTFAGGPLVIVAMDTIQK